MVYALFYGHPIVCGGSVFGILFCYAFLSVISSFAIILT